MSEGHSTPSAKAPSPILETIRRRVARRHRAGWDVHAERNRLLDAAGFASYEAYVTSATWHRKRAEMFSAGMPKTCVMCGAKPVTLHHVCYRHVTKERFGDLLPVCERHHTAIHEHLSLLGADAESTLHVIRFIMGWSVTKLNLALANYHAEWIRHSIEHGLGTSPEILPPDKKCRVGLAIDGTVYCTLDSKDASVVRNARRYQIREFVTLAWRGMR